MAINASSESMDCVKNKIVKLLGAKFVKNEYYVPLAKINLPQHQSLIQESIVLNFTMRHVWCVLQAKKKKDKKKQCVGLGVL